MLAAEAEDRPDETGADGEPDEPEGDADFAGEVADMQEDEREQREDAADHVAADEDQVGPDSEADDAR